MATRTPWGPSQTSKRVAQGVTEHTTASHGGIKLSGNRWIGMPTCLRHAVSWAGHPWYEEDVDWAIPVLAYPECFTIAYCYHAVRTAERKIQDGYWQFDLNDPAFADVKAKASLYSFNDTTQQ